jgi:RES domain-containing protein
MTNTEGYDEALLEQLATAPAGPWSGIVWRHMFGGQSPELRNGRGARWNPPGVDAVYTSLERDTALAEAEAAMSAQPLRPHAPRDLHRIRVSLDNVIDLRNVELLEALGVPLPSLEQESRETSARIGGAVSVLGHDGAFVWSIRVTGGNNLVIYPNNQEFDAQFVVLESEHLE